MINLVTFKWVSMPLNTPYKTIDSKGQDEISFNITESHLKDILINNNCFDGYYHDYEDFINRYELEHTVEIYNQLNLVTIKL